MIPPFRRDGNLPSGVHLATWSEFADHFGATPYRRGMLGGLLKALTCLRNAGCRTAYVDGSFVTARDVPDDFDACWDPIGVNLGLLDNALTTFTDRRALQKLKYRGELFPLDGDADRNGTTFLRFFQTDKNSGRTKGIIMINLGSLP